MAVSFHQTPYHALLGPGHQQEPVHLPGWHQQPPLDGLHPSAVEGLVPGHRDDTMVGLQQGCLTMGPHHNAALYLPSHCYKHANLNINEVRL